MSADTVFEISAKPTKDAVLQEFARVLSFPQHFGFNLDALADSLADWVEGSTAARTLIVNIHPDFAGTRAHAAVVDIVEHAAQESRRDGAVCGPVTVLVRPGAAGVPTLKQ